MTARGDARTRGSQAGKTSDSQLKQTGDRRELTPQQVIDVQACNSSMGEAEAGGCLEFQASPVCTMKGLLKNAQNQTTKGSHTCSALCRPSGFPSLCPNFLMCPGGGNNSLPTEVCAHQTHSSLHTWRTRSKSNQ